MRPSLRLIELGEWLFRLAGYAFAVYSGLSVLVFPPRSYDSFAEVMTVGWGGLQLVCGAIALFAVARHDSILEWKMLAGLASGIALYAVLSWINVFLEAPSHGGRAGDITFLLALISARFFYLWKQHRRAEIKLRARADPEEAS